MGRRADSDEHYVLDLCDEVLGQKGQRQATFDWLRGDASPARPLGTKLPVDGFWQDLGLVVEFQEEQHSRPTPFFDRRQTVSGVGRGEQRCRYDERKGTLVSEHGLRLVVIEKAAFTLKSRRIARDRERDVAVVREHLDDADTELPAWVEGAFAEQRRYWRALRDGGLIDSASELECIRREVDG